MNQKLITFALLILSLNCINCYTEVDMITINQSSYLYLSQAQLKSEMASDSNIYNCTAINEYFETFAYNSSLVQNFTLQSHNYLHISFDVAFLNIKEVLGGIIKYGQVDVNGQTTQFSTIVTYDNYKCIPNNPYYVDGKTNISITLPHNGNLNLTFSTSDLGSQARLGISNIAVNSILCGKNAQLDSSTLTCVCQQGYKETLTAYGSPGHIYYEKQCQ
ncbi:hypothetical protein ABPG74_002735 [Tetrahymena malaccensis]